MKKLLSVMMLGLLCLTGCNAKTYKGSYNFQMGKNAGTHFGVRLNIDKNKELQYIDKEGQMINKPLPDNTHDWYTFTLSFDLNLPENSNALQTVKAETPIEGDDDIFSGLEGDIDLDMYGFFYVKPVKLENKIYNIMKFSSIVFFGLDFGEASSFVDLLMVAHITHAKAILTVPVSMSDFEKQLNWITSQGDNYIEGSKPDKSSPDYFYTVGVSLLRE